MTPAAQKVFGEIAKSPMTFVWALAHKKRSMFRMNLTVKWVSFWIKTKPTFLFDAHAQHTSCQQ